jgi:hypothetical protein
MSSEMTAKKTPSKKFGKISEAPERFYFKISVTGLSRTNSRKEYLFTGIIIIIIIINILQYKLMFR